MSKFYNPWFAERGLAFVRVFDVLKVDWFGLYGVYSLMTVPSQRFPGGWHCVVGQFQRVEKYGCKLVVAHDPNPENKPYDQVEGFDIFKSVESIGFVVPIVPVAIGNQ